MKKIDSDEEASEENLQALENIVMRAQTMPTSSNANIVDGLLKFARIQMAISRRAHNECERPRRNGSALLYRGRPSQRLVARELAFSKFPCGNPVHPARIHGPVLS